MSLSRDFLRAMGIEEDKITAIVQEHTKTTDSMKQQIADMKKERDDFKAEAEKVPGLQKEIETLKGGEDFQKKYNDEHQAFEDYKAEVSKKEEAEKVKAAYRKLLADEQIKADRIDFVVAHTDLSTVTLDKDGNLSNVDALKETINDSSNGWGMFKVTTTKQKPAVATPPDRGTGSGVSRAKELAQKFHQERYGVKPDTGKE